MNNAGSLLAIPFSLFRFSIALTSQAPLYSLTAIYHRFESRGSSTLGPHPRNNKFWAIGKIEKY